MLEAENQIISSKKYMRAKLAGNRQADFEAMLRVDHAGETAAVAIYEAQIAVFEKKNKNSDFINLLKHMLEQEKNHLETFNQLLPEYNVQKSRLNVLWKVAGTVLGTMTAMIGEKMAMACTESVETVIDEHYSEQSATIMNKNDQLLQIIEKFRLEELEHRDLALANDAKNAIGYSIAEAVIKNGCKVAINIAEKI
jgi:ubiquinone biosynthesis monooxygenase Coq7